MQTVDELSTVDEIFDLLAKRYEFLVIVGSKEAMNKAESDNGEQDCDLICKGDSRETLQMLRMAVETVILNGEFDEHQ